MSALGDITRLNVLLELFSECADAPDLETLLRTAAGRFRWVIDFDRCTFVIGRKGAKGCFIGTHAEEALHHVALADLPAADVSLAGRVFDGGFPAEEPPGRICIPLQARAVTLGTMSFFSEASVYTHRDMRLCHHAGQYLGSLICRMDLEDATRRFSQRKDDLLALLGHELRNPLAPIVAAVHLLRAHDDGRSSKELGVIERQTQHLVRLVDDLLDVARLTRGRTVLRPAPVEVARVVARAVEMAAPLLEERRHLLRVDVPAYGLPVNADESRLAVLFFNLLSNAAHFTPPGGHVSIAAHRDGEAVALEVSDDGIGIAADALVSIFDLFVRESNRSDGHGGLGLGLVVVKQLTELHGGSVSAESEGRGRGATFTVRLPLMTAGSVASPRSAPSQPIPPAETPQRVLLVDDNSDALELLSTLVASAGHEVASAHDGVQALEVFDTFQPSVAVIDIGMPVMDGYELAARIRAQGRDEQPYLLALTGYGQPKDRERSRAAGFDGHLVKPVDLAHLLRVIAGAGEHPTNAGRAG